MSILMITALAAAMAGTPPATHLSHTIHHQHQGRNVTATYEGVTNIALKQRGMASAPGRMSTQICDWNANIHVSRTPPGSEPTPLGSRTVLSGLRAGDCLTVASGIERDVARRNATLRDHVVTVAEADGPVVATSIAVAGGGSE
ncbi:hypothetical protein HL653_05290 [Sphingomonas sp. AP4-R1]|uniref:hypothetical protein n=1 Tax=Sphingomonas sp. AP4-R1 TaxID=2735134 RepID=UPI001493C6E4|nr:hypothetical protein [Sphingomonas sp. AP4-R1]QJU57286.1 hypothetical protein HL653_05290 [Sphingomonas sp. AP4-R1]